MGWKGVSVGGYWVKGLGVRDGAVRQAGKRTMTVTQLQRITRFNIPVSPINQLPGYPIILITNHSPQKLNLKTTPFLRLSWGVGGPYR